MGVTPLPDNYSSDQYFYQILVFTGHRNNAGTQSKVRLKEREISDLNLYNRFNLFLRVIMMKHVFELLLILIERFYNVVESMLSSWLYQSKTFSLFERILKFKS